MVLWFSHDLRPRFASKVPPLPLNAAGRWFRKIPLPDSPPRSDLHVRHSSHCQSQLRDLCQNACGSWRQSEGLTWRCYCRGRRGGGDWLCRRQPNLGASPIHEIGPKHKPAERRKAGTTEPLPSGGVGNARQNRKLLRVQGLIKPSFLHGLVNIHIAKLFVAGHTESAGRELHGEGPTGLAAIT